MMTRDDLIPVLMETPLGSVLLGIDTARAPVSGGAFLARVDGGLLDDCTIYRIVTAANQASGNGHPIEVIQWGLTFEQDDGLSPIAHEPTSVTGLQHRRGTLSMARREPGSAGRAYFFCLGGDLASLDEGGGRHPDGHGFAAFGQILEGWDVIEAIFAAAEEKERLDERIAVTRVRRA
ncbi:MAG: peptidylprolyl isomerase [Devosia sp.]|nr:peptidylprolyl isomerase [Devosia sp.]